MVKVVSIANDLKKALAEKKVIFGTSRTFKELLKGRIAKIFVSSNCPDYVREKLKYLCQTSGVDVQEVSNSNEELGVMCKKPFLISVLSFVK